MQDNIPKRYAGAVIDTLTRVHPLWYLFGFALTPVIFALVYAYFVPNGFYAPYAKLESRASADGLRLMEVLHNSLKGFFEQYNGKLRDSANQDEKRPIQLIEVHNPDWGSGSEVELRLLIRVSDPDKEKERSLVFSVVLTPWEREETSDGSVRWMLLDKGEKFSDFLGSRIIGSPHKQSRLDAIDISKPYITLGSDEDVFFRRYLAGLRGDATGFSGEFGRLLYFSVITVTTVGYGDIVPITGWARFLAALEAIMGVILIGLFLNSLFDFRRRGR